MKARQLLRGKTVLTMMTVAVAVTVVAVVVVVVVVMVAIVMIGRTVHQRLHRQFHHH